jgi:hypothetical protein
VRGGLGNDIVVGGAGQDLIKAGSGDDELMALDGERDWVRCGRGNDLARVDAKDEAWGCERTLHRPHDGGGGSGGRGYPSLAHIDWDGDFDPGCRLVGGQGGSDSKVAGTDHPGTVSIERSIVGEGHCAARFSTPAGHGTGRAEVARHNSKPSQTVQFEELLWIPSKANNGPDHGSITQTKMNSNPCYNGGLTLPKEHPGHLGYSTVASCSAGSRKFDLGPFPHNQWIAVKVTEKFADNGYVAVWLDPDGAGPAGYHVVLPRTRADTTPVNVGVKYRQGLYHTSPISSETGSTSTAWRTVDVTTNSLAEGVVSLLRSFDALLRHRLLRKTGGFESCGFARIETDSYGLPVAKRPHRVALANDLQAASLAPALLPYDYNDLIACVDDLDSFLAIVLPRSKPDTERFPDPLVAVIDATFGEVREVILDLRVKRIQRSLIVATIERLTAAPDDLDVLLRHRPRSISRGASRVHDPPGELRELARYPPGLPSPSSEGSPTSKSPPSREARTRSRAFCGSGAARRATRPPSSPTTFSIPLNASKPAARARSPATGTR